MNCQDFELTLREIVRDQSDVKTRESSLAHAKHCAMCAERLAAEQALLTGVRAVIVDIADQNAPERVETALRTAFRAHVASSMSPIPTLSPVNNRVSLRWRSIKSSLWPQWRLVATAATIIILVSVIAALWGQSKSSIEKPITRAVIPAPAKPDEQRSETVSAADSTPDRVRVRRHPPWRRTPEPEIVTEFYPLIEGANLDSEVVQMVRVELPGSALRAAGLPVGQELMNEPVKADVMLGYDGLARAIRFVR